MASDGHSLASITLIGSLPEAERQAFEKQCAWQEYKAGSQIIDRDSDTRQVYFVTSGTVRVVNYSMSGREVSYDDIRAGGFFGELAAIDGKPRSANVVAIKKSLIASVSGEVFLRFVTSNPEMAMGLLERMVMIIRGGTDRIMDLTTLGAYHRVYAELLRLARDSGGMDDDGSGVIRELPTHSSLASRVGTTRETVARAIGELTRRGVAEKRGKGLYFADYEELEDIVEGGEVD